MNLAYDTDVAHSTISPFVKVARIPELLNLVLEHLPKRALVKLAATCHLLFEPSVAMLWSTGGNDLLRAMVDLLPSDVVMHGGEGSIRRPGERFGCPTKHELRRIHLYGRFVRDLQLFYSVEWHVLDSLRMPHHFSLESPILPNLRSLRITYGSDNILLAQILLCPSVCHLYLTGCADVRDDPPAMPVLALLERLPERCPNLETFVIDWNGYWTDAENASIAQALRHLPRLHTVDIEYAAFTDSIVESLLELPCLRRGKMDEFSFREDAPSKASVHQAIGSKSFDALKNLDCYCSLAICSVISSHCPVLEHLALNSETLPSLDEVAQFAETLRSRGQLRSLSMHMQPFFASEVWECLKPLSALPIQSFTLLCCWERSAALYNDQAFRLFSSWNDLKSLDVTLPSSKEGRTPDLSTLTFLFEHCPKLLQLNLTDVWDGSSSEQSWDACRSKLTKITVCKPHISISRFAKFLSVVCPDVHVLGFTDADQINEYLKIVQCALAAEKRRRT
ncbi:hypothetical protein CALVIDRAFT_542768 [Calocera viscosa TUFC12733]|uniref:F-box domain-containing protein n=1 Tax=Calocera viscosa (strain TUFC12733) TaxID=1330018 RepID=A0A167GAR7_CALVF|nr:hypothetical protein CALVIDRAFT_542768 [Calocera viscosa TUFC12733]